MLFNSFLFLFAFLPVVVAGYWLIARMVRPIAAIAWLAVASYVFYLSGERVYPWMLAGSIVFNFLVGQRIGSAEGAARRAWLTLGVVADLALLGVYKYLGFVGDQLGALGVGGTGDWRMILPIGISFFTFTQIAYLVDVATRKTSSPDLVRYGLFVSYFPHLIAGPILHNKEMLPQFEQPDIRHTASDLYSGLAMLSIGLAKKVLIADGCGQVASGVFAAAGDGTSFFVAWVGAIAYTLQIYFDFSAYSDMAIGVSRMLGIDLPINFNSPYKAVSIIEFWRRWHITLSRFLRDYVYIPLGGNRKGEARRFVNLFATMLIGGAWHGAGWTFILWGAMHGTAQTLAHGWRALGKTTKLPAIPPLLGWALTMLFVVLAWIPFRAPNLNVTFDLWRGLAGLQGFLAPDIGLARRFAGALGGIAPVSFGSTDILLMGFASLIALLAPNSQQLLRDFNIGLDSPGYNAHGGPTRLRLAANGVSVVVIAVLLGLSLRKIGGYSEFIYFQF